MSLGLRSMMWSGRSASRGSTTGSVGAGERFLRKDSSCDSPMRSSNVRVQGRAAIAFRRSIFSGAMNSPPMLHSAMKA